MRAMRWIMAVSVAAMLGIGHTSSLSAAPISQTEPPLAMTITTAQTEGVVGAPMTWHITLAPREGGHFDTIHLESGDVQTWLWPDGARVIAPLTTTLVTAVTAIPLVSGEIRPVLKAQYILDEAPYEEVIAGAPVHVRPVEAFVEAGVIALQGTARANDGLPMQIWIRNSSPVTLTGVQIHGSGTDLARGEWLIPDHIPPGAMHYQEISPLVTGSRPQPMFSVEYGWIGAVRNPYTPTLHISGEPAPFKETIWEQIPREGWALLIGLLGGVLTSILTGLGANWVARRIQRGVDRRHLRGLLQMVTVEAQYAARQGSEVDLKPLQTIFETEGLYTAAINWQLDEAIRDVWQAARRHNTDLGQPGGLVRMQELEEAVKQLRDRLQEVERRSTSAIPPPRTTRPSPGWK